MNTPEKNPKPIQSPEEVVKSAFEAGLIKTDTIIEHKWLGLQFCEDIPDDPKMKLPASYIFKAEHFKRILKHVHGVALTGKGCSDRGFRVQAANEHAARSVAARASALRKIDSEALLINATDKTKLTDAEIKELETQAFINAHVVFAVRKLQDRRRGLPESPDSGDDPDISGHPKLP